MTKPHTIKRHGWIPDLPDHRDFVLALKSTRLPASVDLRPEMPSVYDQGQLGSCTGNAIAAALEFDAIKQGQLPVAPSRLFIYYNERRIEGTVGTDSGAQIRDGIKSVATDGACAEILWPYRPKSFAVKPSAKAYAAAKEHPALVYQRVPQTAAAVKGCLAAGFPIVFGFTVYDSFESEEVAKTGVLNLPLPGEQVVGGHAVLAVGYTGSRVIVRNSWGASWGQAGYFTMPLPYMLNSNLADDLWQIDSVK